MTADTTIPLWPLHTHHSFHQSNPAPTIVAHSRSAFDDPRQYRSDTTASTLNDLRESKTIDDVFSSRKAPLAPNYRQHRTAPVKTLAGTQSWNETSRRSQPLSQPVHLPKEPSTHRSIFIIPMAIGSPVSKIKAIYVAIDHNATLAERRLQEARHHHHHEHHSREGRGQSPSDQFSKTHRNRHHIDLSSTVGNIQSSHSIDPRPVKSASTHGTTFAPQLIPNDLQTASSKVKKYRHERSSPHPRHPSSITSKEASSQSQTRIRTSDHQSSTTPMMRLSLPRPDRTRAKQSLPPTMTYMNDSRARSHLLTALSWIISVRPSHSLFFSNKNVSSSYHP